MGKHRIRVKGKGGKHWGKGQSSSSNPVTNTYRDAAKSRFFQENLNKKSNLTSDALEIHDAFMGSERSKSTVSVDGETHETESVSTFKTFRTFATDWSECSNMSFNRLLKGFNSKSALHKEMLAILAAVTEVIKSNGGKETSTEYFAALITTLEASDTEESISAILSLLGMGIKTVPQNVLRLKFSELSKSFVELTLRYSTSSNNVILRQLIGCLSVLLRAQDIAVWSNSSTLQVFDSILSFSVYSKPKVRKAAKHAVCAVLKGSCFMLSEDAPAYHPAAAHVAKYCVHQLETGNNMGSFTPILHILALLKEILGCFSKINLKQTCEGILKVMTLGNVFALSCGLQALHGLFLSRPSSSSLPGELNAQLISALFDYQPAATDQQPTLAWLAVMQEAYVNLGRLDLNLWSANLPHFFSVASNLWLTERTEIINCATLSMEAVLESSLEQVCTHDNIKFHEPMVRKIIQIAETGMKYQYHTAWPYVLHLLGTIFEITGETCFSHLQPCLKSLAELRDTKEFTFKNELDNALGRAVKSMGPEKVLSAIPLQITGFETSNKFERSWMLPVLKANIQGAPLKFFINYFLPLATICRRQAETSENRADIESYSLLQSQIWSLLPSFCNKVPDLPESFKGIAKILGVVIADYKDFRFPVMTALRRIITYNQNNYNEQNLNEMKKFAKNYLPILFNVYATKPSGTEEQDQRQAVLETVKVYLSIASPELCSELFDKACEKLESDGGEFQKESVLDLLRCLMQYQSASNLEVLYSLLKKNLTNKESNYQKKYYRLLEEICGNSSENCRNFVANNFLSIQELLLNTFSSCSPSTKGARLRCLIHLVEKMEKCEISTLEHIIPEAILCCKDVNEKCRTAAFKLLVLIGQLIERSSNKTRSEALEDYIKLIIAGLSGSCTLVSATLLALGNVCFQFKDAITDHLQRLLLDNVCLLVVSSAREVVSSALSYVKAFTVATPIQTLGPCVPTIVKSLLSMTEDCKRYFRLKCRDILDRLVRKFSYSAIAKLVPEDDAIMHKRLRNLQKINERKKKRIVQTEDDNSHQDDIFKIKNHPKTIDEILEDSDLEDTPAQETKTSKKNRHNTWIHEDADSIVDFMDVDATKKIVVSLPSTSNNSAIVQKKKNSMPFKMSSEGRLIITDNYDDDDDDKNDKIDQKVRRIPQEDSDDDFNDLQSRAESTKGVVNRKRKLSDPSISSEPGSKYKAGGSGIHRAVRTNAKKSTPRGPNWATGEVYRARKAKGDVKKKGLPDPYAYVPLSRKLLNRRKKLKHAGKFKNMVRAAKKGAVKGSIMKAKNRSRKK